MRCLVTVRARTKTLVRDGGIRALFFDPHFYRPGGLRRALLPTQGRGLRGHFWVPSWTPTQPLLPRVHLGSNISPQIKTYDFLPGGSSFCPILAKHVHILPPPLRGRNFFLKISLYTHDCVCPLLLTEQTYQKQGGCQYSKKISITPPCPVTSKRSPVTRCCCWTGAWSLD
jgi:hypothetical protein